MKPKKSKTVANSKPTAAATDEKELPGKAFSPVLGMPPAEIADYGEARVGCSGISGRFPAYR